MGSSRQAVCTNKPNSARPADPPGLLEGKTCKTNPIGAGASGRRMRNKPNSAKLAGRPGPRRAKTCETNPICAGVQTSVGRVCKTKPISDRRDIPPFQCSIIPPFQSDAECAKQTQFAAGGQGRPSPRACPERSEWAFGHDDAIRHGGNGAKQSQFRQRVESQVLSGARVMVYWT